MRIRRGSGYGEVVYTIDGNRVKRGYDVVYTIDGNKIRAGSSSWGDIVYTIDY